VDEFSMENIERARLDGLRAELGVEPEAQVVLMVVGRAIWSKGVREFVEVSQSARHWGLPVKFVLVGPVEPHNPDAVPQDYLTSAASPGFVHLPFRDDIRELLALANVVVLPSYYREGVPRVLLEALAMQKPVVTTDSVGCREVVEHGRNGFLVPIKDSPSLGSAIRTLLEDRDLQATFGEQSLVRAREQFDERKIVQRVLTDVYGFPAEGGAAELTTDRHLVTT
jgi:N,N'-diacetylbacillosaminyl-diphospho-undecaprenol alpha-1,3-N-acetylgalactosaminyltransferase